jgi:hypothetical protein
MCELELLSWEMLSILWAIFGCSAVAGIFFYGLGVNHERER